MLTNTRGAAHLNKGRAAAAELHFRLFVFTEANWPLIIIFFLSLFFFIFLIQIQFPLLNSIYFDCLQVASRRDPLPSFRHSTAFLL